MKLIIGLGNPGSEYDQTPHNIGFTAIERLAAKLGAEWKTDKKFKARAARTAAGSEPLWLLEPQTYMNLSGESAAPFMRYYGMTPADLLVLSDDCDLPLGRLRMRPAGSAGGHRGLLSLITHLGTQQFARLRIGVGRPEGRGLAGFVLGRFGADQAPAAAESADAAAEAALCWVRNGLNEAMNRFNGGSASGPEPLETQ